MFKTGDRIVFPNGDRGTIEALGSVSCKIKYDNGHSSFSLLSLVKLAPVFKVGDWVRVNITDGVFKYCKNTFNIELSDKYTVAQRIGSTYVIKHCSKDVTLTLFDHELIACQPDEDYVVIEGI